ncbi:hypothetical protein BU24DRAFT_416084 [Aaosphaeria arxii CBS 175.79]|uniref:Transcription initiation factor TFIID subunit 8 n=1 Tax=Aaosphaeria arxii CBS 175.79 TaxID=1450172 RepID=A0A6A5Y4E9_9PLEO|nr:uncharacterized protein BU24DRAFT_416084 [Aaosphaeria arxii CBS 175.79]KAF2020378.1 hypothetical protein BU24DRAFT_416084 [Aaosphaeria arxii CBS 175.79]
MPGMKRSNVETTLSEPHAKKRKIVRQLHHLQQAHVPEPISAEQDPTGVNRDFFDQQLQRAIAIECKAIGFDGTRPDALEMFRGLVDGFMHSFTTHVRTSMMSARRTSTVASDWVHALQAVGIKGSSVLEPHLDTGEIPPSFLQPAFEPPRPASPPPPDLEGLLGRDLSGKTDKEQRKYIPSHFPSFPSRHTWKATPVFTPRESDPRKIREKATEEGILAEQSLRKLMAAQKAGLQGDKARKQRRSKRIKQSDALWQDAMKDLQGQEEEREEVERRRPQFDFGDDMEEDDDAWRSQEQARMKPPRLEKKKPTIQEGVHVNYDQKFWRKSARGF